MKTTRPFIVISGIPGSGKTTLGRSLAASFRLPLIDKDDILSGLFGTGGTGDAAWRRALSRESDVIFQREAAAARHVGAVLVSFWRLRGMAADSGTPADWIPELSVRIVNVHCICSPEIAARRFHQRERHPGHLDSAVSFEDTLAGLRELARLGPPDVGPRIDVDTSGSLDFDGLVRETESVLARQH